jgi:hypothetical protein
LIESVASNVPRLDYTNGSCPSLLVEPQRRNLALYSSSFDNASWEKTIITSVTANTIISPSGIQDGDTITCNGTGTLFTRQSVYSGTTQKCSNSIFAKKGNTRYFALRNFGELGGSHDVFDFDTKTWTQNTAAVLSYKELEDGWFRLTSVNSDIIGNYYISFFPAENTSGLESDIVNNKFVYVWGAQAELGSYATSYIPTVASTVTRVAETASKTGISSLINSGEGVFYVEIASLAFNTSKDIEISDGNLNRIIIQFNTVGIAVILINNGSTIYSYNYVYNDLEFKKVAFKYKQNDFSVFVNGIKLDSSSSGVTFPASTLTRLDFNKVTPASLFFDGKVKDLRVYNTALTDQELQQLTSL